MNVQGSQSSDSTTAKGVTPPKLSARERQLLELASKGFTDQGIAHELEISVPTVATYWGRIRIKMGPLSRPELVAHYVESESAVQLEELRRENEALKARLEINDEAQKSQHPTLDSIQELIRLAPDAVLFVDQVGQILFGNDAAATLFGCSAEEFPKLRVGHFIPSSLHEIHRQHREQFFADGVRVRMGDHTGVTACRLNGDPIRIVATVSVAVTPQGPIAIVFARESDTTVRGWGAHTRAW